MHENMLWCFHNAPMGVYHNCGHVTCQSRVVTLHLTAVHYSSNTLTPALSLFPLLLLLVSNYILQKKKKVQCLVCNQCSMSFLSCVIFSQLISEFETLLFMPAHAWVAQHRHINSDWFTVADVRKLE